MHAQIRVLWITFWKQPRSVQPAVVTSSKRRSSGLRSDHGSISQDCYCCRYATAGHRRCHQPASTSSTASRSSSAVPTIIPHTIIGVTMPRSYSSIDKIRAELAWVTETPDTNKCGCRNVRCCEETGHKPGACSGAVATKFWTFRWEYYCAPAVNMDGVAVRAGG